MTINSDKNLLVYNASAGSGKTFTLVREYLKLALKGENPLYFRKILAITFTRKAAAEMKERVIRTLKSLSANASDPEFDATLLQNYTDFLQLDSTLIQSRSKAVLSALLHNYADVSIATIDRFTQKLIRSFAKDLSIPIDFEVMLEHDEVLQEAVDRLLNETGVNAELTTILTSFLRSLIHEERNWKMEVELFRFSKTLFDESSINYVTELQQLNENDFKAIYSKINSRLKSIKSEIHDAAQKACQLVENYDLSLDDFSYKKNSGVNIFYQLKKSHGDLNKLSSYNRFLQLSDPSKKWYPANSKKETIQAIEALIPEILPYHNIIANYLETPDYYLLSVINDQFYSLSLLFKVEQKIQEIKTEREILFIEDFNRIISDLVLHEPAPFIYEKAGEWYAHILIDEFQDTSVLQWQNFIPLIENALSNGTSCMLVGDGKQAIYRFRNGEVEQMAILPRIFGSESNELLQEKEFLFAENFKAEQLTTNFRSQKSIVLFNNSFFKNFYSDFSHALKNVYEHNEQEILPNKQLGYVEWKMVEATNTTEKIPLQLLYTLDSIKKCLEDGFKKRDITCLVHRNKEGSLLAQFLTENGIPVISSDSLLINSSLTVRFLFATIHLMDDWQNQELTGKWLEYFCRIKNRADEASEIIIEFKEQGKINIFPFLKRENITFYPDDLAKYPLYQQVELILEIFNISTKDVYVNAFFEEIFSFISQGKSRLDFINYWIKNGDKKSVKISGQSDAVQIMTIHKSKGLQFPVVILPFADWDMIKKTKSKVWINIESLDTPLKHIIVSNNQNLLQHIKQDEIYESEKSRTLLDHINLLYVAFTRPEERLYFCTSDLGDKRISSKIIAYATPIFSEQDSTVKKLGVPSAYLVQDSFNEKNLEIKTIFSPRWREKIRISYEAGRAWADDDRYESARFGSRIHEILAKISEHENPEMLVDQIATNENWSNDEQIAVQIQLSRILKHPFIQKLLQSKSSRSEMEIVDRNGRVYRPDRLVFSDQKVQVIDFKTGEAREQHLEQINLYAELISGMGYQEVEKFLFYTQNCELILVK